MCQSLGASTNVVDFQEAVTDARKRALRQFGRSLGGCIYEKEFLKEVKPGAVAVHTQALW